MLDMDCLQVSDAKPCGVREARTKTLTRVQAVECCAPPLPSRRRACNSCLWSLSEAFLLLSFAAPFRRPRRLHVLWLTADIKLTSMPHRIHLNTQVRATELQILREKQCSR
jgi:hypothetical protein